ncbi:hypothetical protein GPA10_17520 [Streptomyces sp. p1417]|uniref:FG-GAP repeat-containing protein n=1 Tax=Streptomyces typhae TaxID=2681492 RepID=A0A6L6WYE9_9ACTN|nr:VCBS repeat-containing protein [Streptomyces typhae]MVO86511.1 hypothetical protein [Streptomyces typhae]
MRLRPTPALLTLTTALAAATLAPLAGAAPAAAAPAKWADDFNGDGFRDYVTQESNGSNKGGAVRVTFGTGTGPGPRSQVVDQRSPGVPGADERGDAWGERTRVAADFNRDGYGDLVVSAVGEKVGRNRGQGTVTVLWGSSTGLTGGTSVPNEAARAQHAFGSDLAVGDFDGDGRQDLAAVNGGDAYVYKGGISRSGVDGSVRRLHRSGLTADDLVAGRVTKDSATDLVIVGSVLKNDEEVADAWFVKGGRTLAPGRTLRLGAYAVDSTSAVIADFDRNGYGDIAIGNQADSGYRGAVTVWRGGSSGPGTSARVTQATRGLAGTPEKGDRFGASLSADDVNDDEYPDLAVGVDGEDIDGKDRAGGVHVLRGSGNGSRSGGGLTGTGSRWFARDTRGIPGPVSEGDGFGATVRLRDTDLDGYADLYVDGAWGEVRLPGSASGPKASGATSPPGRITGGITGGILQ